MKRKRVKLGVLAVCGMIFAACGSAERQENPQITNKPKPLIIEAATPTPTLTVEQEEIPKVSEVPSPTEMLAPTVTPTNKPTPTPTPTSKVEATKKPTATPVPTKQESTSYEKGVLTENSFKSKWMGLRFTSPDGVELSTQEELDKTMRLLAEALYGETPVGALDYEKLSVVFELSAVWQDEGVLMQVMVEKLTQESATVEEYVAQMKEEVSVLGENGLTYIMDDKLYSEMIGGKEFSNFGYTTYAAEGVGLRQENYLRKQDDRIILISIMCEDGEEESISRLLNAFSAY